MSQDPLELPGLGALLREARLRQGLGLPELAERLHWRQELLEAVEAEAWERIPPGQERPMVRQMAALLACDLDAHREAFARVPGEPAEEGPDPRQSRLERHATFVLGLALVGALAWLLKPGEGLRAQPEGAARPQPSRAWMAGERPRQPFPVLGEALPEAPVTEEGILVYLRVQDLCRIQVSSGAGEVTHEVHPGTPWQGRVKGPFRLALDNAGVGVLHVAGRRIAHGRPVGEGWSGSFDAQGLWLQAPLPQAPEATPAAAPEPLKDPEDPQESF